MSKFKIGDKICKPKGYRFDGTVVSVFNTTSGDIRIVAEMEDNGMLHIFNENQLEIRDNLPVSDVNKFSIYAKELLDFYIRERGMSLEDAKNHVLDYKILFEIDTLPEFIREYWIKIKDEIVKFQFDSYHNRNNLHLH